MLERIIGVEEAASILNLSAGTIKNKCASKELECKKIGKTWILDKEKLEEMIKMKQTYNEVRSALKYTDKIHVEFYNNLKELQETGFDEDTKTFHETIDNNWYVFGSKTISPSDLNEPFILIDDEGASDLPIFTKDRKDEVIHYLKGNYRHLVDDTEFIDAKDDIDWVHSQVESELIEQQLKVDVEDYMDDKDIDLEQVKELYHDGLREGLENGRYLTFKSWFYAYTEEY